MKMRLAVLSLAILASGFLIWRQAQRPTALDFTFGTRPVVLLRADFEGQQRIATLLDSASLRYLSMRPRFKAAPMSMQVGKGLSFTGKLFDQIGKIGEIDILVGPAVSSDESLMRLGCYESIFDEPRYCYVTIDSNAPTVLNQLIQFLLDEANRGKSWTANVVKPIAP